MQFTDCVRQISGYYYPVFKVESNSVPYESREFHIDQINESDTVQRHSICSYQRQQVRKNCTHQFSDHQNHHQPQANISHQVNLFDRNCEDNRSSICIDQDQFRDFQRRNQVFTTQPNTCGVLSSVMQYGKTWLFGPVNNSGNQQQLQHFSSERYRLRAPGTPLLRPVDSLIQNMMPANYVPISQQVLLFRLAGMDGCLLDIAPGQYVYVPNSAQQTTHLWNPDRIGTCQNINRESMDINSQGRCMQCNETRNFANLPYESRTHHTSIQQNHRLSSHNHDQVVDHNRGLDTSTNGRGNPHSQWIEEQNRDLETSSSVWQHSYVQISDCAQAMLNSRSILHPRQVSINDDSLVQPASEILTRNSQFQDRNNQDCAGRNCRLQHTSLEMSEIAERLIYIVAPFLPVQLELYIQSMNLPRHNPSTHHQTYNNYEVGLYKERRSRTVDTQRQCEYEHSTNPNQLPAESVALERIQENQENASICHSDVYRLSLPQTPNVRKRHFAGRQGQLEGKVLRMNSEKFDNTDQNPFMLNISQADGHILYINNSSKAVCSKNAVDNGTDLFNEAVTEPVAVERTSADVTNSDKMDTYEASSFTDIDDNGMSLLFNVLQQGPNSAEGTEVGGLSVYDEESVQAPGPFINCGTNRQTSSHRVTDRQATASLCQNPSIYDNLSERAWRNRLTYETLNHEYFQGVARNHFESEASLVMSSILCDIARSKPSLQRCPHSEPLYNGFNQSQQSSLSGRPDEAQGRTQAVPDIRTLHQYFHDLNYQFYIETFLWIMAKLITDPAHVSTNALLQLISGILETPVEEVLLAVLTGFMEEFIASTMQEMELADMILREVESQRQVWPEAISTLQDLAVLINIRLDPCALLRRFCNTVRNLARSILLEEQNTPSR